MVSIQVCIIALARDESDPIQLLMAKDGKIVRAYISPAANFIVVFVSEGMDGDHISPAKRTQVCEGSRRTVGEIYMACQYGITCPGGESCALKVTNLIAEPRDIPAALAKGDSYNRKSKIQLIDFQPYLMIKGVLKITGLIRDGIHPVG